MSSFIDSLSIRYAYASPVRTSFLLERTFGLSEGYPCFYNM